jgi:Zn-finger in ubiquitin-hydrolases and other protein
VDREYSDWKEIEVIIGVNKNLKFIYQTLKPRIYEIASQTITPIIFLSIHIWLLQLRKNNEVKSILYAQDFYICRLEDGCEERLQMGSDWLYLKLCLSCGHAGCCDFSANTHATKHFKSAKHPIIRLLS